MQEVFEYGDDSIFANQHLYLVKHFMRLNV